MREAMRVPRPRRPLVVASVLALLALTFAPASVAPAAAGEGCGAPPEVFPIEDLRPGMRGTGETVIEGREPATFDVEILGIQPGGIAPGLDLILVKVSGEAIEATGGIAAGFSGSPVTIDGRLVGALAYGFWSGDMTIGGLTPGARMVEVLGYPTATASRASRTAAKVRLSEEVRRVAARAAGTTLAEVPGSLKRLPVPLGVSGLGERGFAALEDRIREERLPFVPFRGSSAAAPARDDLDAEPLEPGDSIAVVYSYGDVTYAGVGTVTITCGDRLVAFGHPMAFSGSRIPLGMNGADVVTTVADPLWGSYKLANVAEPHGTIDQDRLAGVRGIEGVLPSLVTVTTETDAPDLDRSRTGTTSIARRDYWLPSIAWDHVWMNIDVVYDQVGPGMLTMDWEISGLRASGEPFVLARENMYWSDWDVSWDSTEEFYYHLYALTQNEFERVRLTGADVRQTVTEHRRMARIVEVRSASELQPELAVREALRVRPGETVLLQALLEPLDGGEAYTTDLSVRIPKRARRSGYLTLRGGNTDEWGVRATSFDQMLTRLANREKNCDLVVQLWARGMVHRKKLTFGQDTLFAPEEEEGHYLRLRVIR